MNKILRTFLLGTMIIASTALSCFAAEEVDGIDSTTNRIPVVEETIVPKYVAPLEDAQYISCKVKGKDFNDDFWVTNSDEDGKTLNIYIKNNGNKPVEHEITHGKNAVRSSGTIKPGKHVLLKLKSDKGGRWTIDVNSADGSKMNVKVEARQF